MWIRDSAGLEGRVTLVERVIPGRALGIEAAKEQHVTPAYARLLTGAQANSSIAC